MRLSKLERIRFLRALGTVIILGALFYFKAQQNYRHQDYINSNFFSFWLSGHMAWTGESPYNASQFMAGFDAFGATYRPSKILQYPLPLMYFVAPVGWLPVGAAYFVWQLITEIVIAGAVFALLRRHPKVGLLFPLICVAMLFFGPVYLTLQVGSVGAISLLAITVAIVLLQKKQPLLAGAALSLTLLKPSQALTLMTLACAWFLMRREWKALAGLAVGGFALLAVWMIRDPLWLVKFRGSSDFLLGHTLGVQSNVFGFAYLACGSNVNCMWTLGSVAAVLVVAVGILILGRSRRLWSDWQAFNLIIPLGFLTSVYLWSYDQLLYVIPIVWISAQLFEWRRSFIPVIAVLIVLDVASFAALAMQAATQRDLWSLGTTVLVLILCLWLRDQPRSASMTGEVTALGAT